MRELFARFGVKFCIALGGALTGLVWLAWSASDETGSSQCLERIPTTVLGGGGGLLVFDIQLNQPALFSATFGVGGGHSGDPGSQIQAEEPLQPGTHRMQVDVPPQTYCDFEVGIPDAEVGARLTWMVWLNGELLLEEDMALDASLRPGHAFFVQLQFEDIIEMYRDLSRRKSSVIREQQPL